MTTLAPMKKNDCDLEFESPPNDLVSICNLHVSHGTEKIGVTLMLLYTSGWQEPKKALFWPLFLFRRFLPEFKHFLFEFSVFAV